MTQPLLYREIKRRVMPHSSHQFENMMVIDGEGALGRIFTDGYDIINQLPAFTAPFSKCWLELGKMHTRADNYQKMTDYHVGVMVEMTDCRGDKLKSDFPKEALKILEDQGADMGWILDMTMNVDTIPLKVGSSMGTYRILITDKGQLIANDIGDGRTEVGQATVSPYYNDFKDYDSQNSEHVEMLNSVIGGMKIIIGDIAFAALFVLGMLNCKNVELAEPVISRKVQKKREKHGKENERYYILKVTGKGARAGSAALRVSSGERNAMHWCRGHFRTYTDDAPLFGKVTGTFWIDSHVRGDRTSGAVDKGYAIDAMQPIPAIKEI